MSNREAETEQPLISSMLYTQGSEKVNSEATEDLKVPDPSPEVAEAAIDQGVKCTSECKCKK